MDCRVQALRRLPVQLSPRQEVEGGNAMDCLRDKRLYLPSLRQVEDPYILLQGRRYLVPKRPVRGKGKGIRGASVHHDGYVVHQGGVMVMKTKHRL
jgi:hypothetical protein